MPIDRFSTEIKSIDALGELLSTEIPLAGKTLPFQLQIPSTDDVLYLIEPPAERTDERTAFNLETELLTEPCACLCCFNLSVEIADLAPGEYVLLFTWYDDSGEWITWTDTVVVEDVGQGGTAHVGSTTNSGCVDPNDSPEPGVEPSLWGKVKAQYR